MNYMQAFLKFNSIWYSKHRQYISKFFPKNQIITSAKIVQSVIDEINIDWTNPNLKICDPCCGSGGFLIYCMIKLLEAGHSEQHIIENMLYGTDIEPQCIEFIKRFWHFNKYKYNLKVDSILNKNWSYDNIKFDLIIMNPPFKEPKIPGKKLFGKSLDIKIWDNCMKLKPKQMYSLTSETFSRNNKRGYTFKKRINSEDSTVDIVLVGYTEGLPKLVQKKQVKYQNVFDWVDLHKVKSATNLKSFRNNKLRGFKGSIPANYIGIPDRSTQWRVFKPGETPLNLKGTALQNCLMFNFTGYDIDKVYNYLTSDLIQNLATEHLNIKNPINNKAIGHTLETGFWECIDIPDTLKIKK